MERDIVEELIKKREGIDKSQVDEIYNMVKEREEVDDAIDTLIKGFTDPLDLAKQFVEHIPIFYDENGIWWKWSLTDKCYEMVDDIDMLNMIADNSNANVIGSKMRVEILNALKQVGRALNPKKPPVDWIQLKDVVIDIETGKKFEATPEYFFTHPLPRVLGKSKETPTIDRLFKEWVGEKYVKTLYQILAYCCIPDYPIHRIFCFIGAGCNGKSQFLKLLRKFIGEYNCTSTELDTLLNSRFEKIRLYKKLVCQMGETNFNEMSQTSLLKKLSGGDLIGFEFKNKDLFDAENYAKILIATNTLPSTTDKTIGFYRRWLIIDFPNRFCENGGDIIDRIPQSEYNNLARKCLRLIKGLIQNYQFHKEGTIEERAEMYEERSNPLEKFWKENIIESFEDHIFKFEFKKEFNAWCRTHGFRKLSDREIKHKMDEKNVETVRRDYFGNSEGETKRYMSWSGIKWKETEKEKPKEESEILSLFPDKGTIKISYLFEQKNLDPQKVNQEVEQLKKEGIISEVRPGEFERI